MSLAKQAQAIADTYLPEHDDTFRQIRRDLARGGRPCSLTPEIIDQLGDAIAETAEYIEDACLAYGIPRRNYYNWMKQGERDDEDGLESPQALFWRTLKAAESQGMVKLGKLWVANPRDFAAYATRKERKAPGKWARRDDTHDGPRIVVNIGVAGGEVKVGIAATLSPSVSEDLHSLSASVNSDQSPIRTNYVNQLEPACASVPSLVNSDRQLPAGESDGDPTPGAPLAGGQRSRAGVKGRSAPGNKKKGRG